MSVQGPEAAPGPAAGNAGPGGEGKEKSFPNPVSIITGPIGDLVGAFFQGSWTGGKGGDSNATGGHGGGGGHGHENSGGKGHASPASGGGHGPEKKGGHGKIHHPPKKNPGHPEKQKPPTVGKAVPASH